MLILNETVILFQHCSFSFQECSSVRTDVCKRRSLWEVVGVSRFLTSQRLACNNLRFFSGALTWGIEDMFYHIWWFWCIAETGKNYHGQFLEPSFCLEFYITVFYLDFFTVSSRAVINVEVLVMGGMCICGAAINAENAVHRSDKFLAMATRTRQEYLKDLAHNYVSPTVVDSGSRLGWFILCWISNIPQTQAHN